MHKPSGIILCGLQASGKSTFYFERFKNTHIRLNLDMLKTRNRERILFEACIAAKANIVIDNTNPTKADRQQYIEPLKAAGYKIEVYYFMSDIENSLKRNINPDRDTVPEVGIRATFKKLKMPTLDEGIDEIHRVWIHERASKTTRFNTPVFAVRTVKESSYG